MVTITHALSGISGGILIASQNKYAITCGLVIFFLKIVLDEVDGGLARETDKSSLTGEVMDPHASDLGSLAFLVGFGFYVASYNNLFLYLIPLVPFFQAIRLKSYSEAYMFRSLVDCKVKLIENKPAPNGEIPSPDQLTGLEQYKKYFYTFNSFLDDRARTVDSICLLILLELHFGFPKITWVIFSLLTLKQFILSLVSYYIIAKGAWMENIVEKSS